MKIYKILFLVLSLSTTFFFENIAQTELEQYFPTVTINESNSPAPGYFFIGSKSTADTINYNYYAIIDNYGTPVFFQITDDVIGGIIYHKNGKTGVMRGIPRKLHILNSAMEEELIINPQGYQIDGHGWAMDSNNHIILLGKSTRTVDMSEIVPGGNPAAQVKDLIIQEFDENQILLYTWNSADYFEITDADSPFVDFTSAVIDYVHVNSIDIDSDTSLIFSCRHMNEITKIDRRTGDIIWRLNGKNNDFTFTNDTLRFSHQHSISKLENGNILLFDNGITHANPISSIAEYHLNEENMTATLVNRYYSNPKVLTPIQGYAQRVFDNTVTGWGPTANLPSIIEFNPNGTTALKLNFSNHLYSTKVGKHIWLSSVMLCDADTLNFGMWDGNNPIDMHINITNNSSENMEINNYSEHTEYFEILNNLPVTIPSGETQQFTIRFNPDGCHYGFINDVITIAADKEFRRDAIQVFLFGQKEDLTPPSAVITPNNDNVAIDSLIRITFNEPVRIDENNELNYENLYNHVTFKKDNNNGENINFTANINTEKTIITLTPIDSLSKGQTYYITFDENLVDYSGNQVISSEAYFTTESNSIVNSIIQTGIKIFPNPSTHFISLINLNQNSNVTIKDILGKTIFSKEDITKSQYQIDVQNLKNGVYILTVKNNSKSESFIFIKQ